MDNMLITAAGCFVIALLCSLLLLSPAAEIVGFILGFVWVYLNLK